MNPAIIATDYLTRGLLLSPLEVLRAKQVLKAFGREPEGKELSLFRGHIFCFVRNFLTATLVENLNPSYDVRGALLMLAISVLTHPLETLQIRSAISERPTGELLSKPWAGLPWGIISTLIGEVATFFVLPRIIKSDKQNPLVPAVVATAVALLMTVLAAPFNALKRLDQAELVTGRSAESTTGTGSDVLDKYARQYGVTDGNDSGSLQAQFQSGLDKLMNAPAKLFAGIQYAVPETLIKIWLSELAQGLVAKLTDCATSQKNTFTDCRESPVRDLLTSYGIRGRDAGRYSGSTTTGIRGDRDAGYNTTVRTTQYSSDRDRQTATGREAYGSTPGVAPRDSHVAGLQTRDSQGGYQQGTQGREPYTGQTNDSSYGRK